jgi:hypothetical protein
MDKIMCLPTRSILFPKVLITYWCVTLSRTIDRTSQDQVTKAQELDPKTAFLIISLEKTLESAMMSSEICFGSD